MFHRLLEGCGRAAQRHPYSWKLAWETIHHLPYLLPHDRSYNAFRHFIAVAPAGLFLDVGANDGISALSFRRFSSDYRIFSLEPNPSLEPRLKGLKAHDLNFDYRIVGAGAASARLQFFVPVYRGVTLHTFTSGSRDQVERAIAEHFGEYVARHTVIKSVDADVVRVDDLGLTPTIVKIDAEGFDHDVLLGCAETITRSRPFIMVEMSWGAQTRIMKFLHEMGYALIAYDIDTDRFIVKLSDLQSHSARHHNIFAVPQEKLGSLPVGR